MNNTAENIDKAVALLFQRGPEYKDQAESILDDAGFESHGKFLDTVIEKYQDETSIKLKDIRPKNLLDEHRAYNWAHRATGFEVIQRLRSKKGITDIKIEIAHQMFLDGKWSDYRTQLEKAFSYYAPMNSRAVTFSWKQKKQKLKEKVEDVAARALKHITDNRNTRMLRTTVHMMTAREVRKHIQDCEMKRKLDEKFQLCWEFHKQGKWSEIYSSDFIHAMTVARKQAKTSHQHIKPSLANSLDIER